MTEAPKRVLMTRVAAEIGAAMVHQSEDEDRFFYVRADIADEDKRQRDKMLTVCHAIVDAADEYTNVAALRAAENAIAECGEVK